MEVKVETGKPSIFWSWVFPASLFLFGLIYWGRSEDYSVTIVSYRDFQRALLIATSAKFPVVGPELNSGSHIIGPFFYYLQALALSFFPGFQAVHFLLILLHSACLPLGYLGLSKLAGRPAGIFFCVVFVSSYILEIELVKQWNPSFLPIFILSAIFLFAFFGRTRRGQLGTGFLIAMALQLHGSVWMLIPAFFLAGWVMVKESKRRLLFLPLGIFLGVLLFRLPYYLIPEHRLVVPPSGDFLDNFPYTSARLLRFLPGFDQIAFFPLRLFRLVGIPLALLAFFPGVRRRLPPVNNLLIWLCLFTLPGAAIFLADGGVPRYSILFVLSFLLLSSLVFQALYDQFWRSPAGEWGRKPAVLAGFSMLLVLQIWFGSLQLQLPFDKQSDLHRLEVRELNQVLAFAHAEGLPSDYRLRNHIYINALSPMHVAPEFSGMIGDRSPESAVRSDAATGILLFRPRNELDPIYFVPPDFAAEIKEGRITILSRRKMGNVEAWSYRSGEQSSYPNGIRNIGIGYEGLGQGNPMKPLSNRQIDICPWESGSSCPGNFYLSQKNVGNGSEITLGLQIPALSFEENMYHPKKSFLLADVKLRVSCGGADFLLPISKALGAAPDVRHLGMGRGPIASELSPVVRRHTIKCSKPISAASLVLGDVFRIWLIFYIEQLGSREVRIQ